MNKNILKLNSLLLETSTILRQCIKRGGGIQLIINCLMRLKSLEVMVIVCKLIFFFVMLIAGDFVNIKIITSTIGDFLKESHELISFLIFFMSITVNKGRSFKEPIL